MCPNDNGACTKPLLPRRWDSLFDSEAGSDVTFLVGPDLWRFPGHRAVLAAANPVFQAMLHGPMASHETTIPIEDVDGRAFENLLRYLYKETVQLQSVSTALHTLYAAFKYQCGGLVKICVLYLDSQLDHSSVLEVYRHLRIYYDPSLSSDSSPLDDSSSSQQSSITPSAPPMEDIAFGGQTSSAQNVEYHSLSGNSDDINEVMSYCGALHHNCLQYIDLHSKEVLEQEQVEDLDLEGLRLIAERETLTLASECVLFDALVRWCNRECKRRQLELSAENKRAVLGEETIHTVRYLLMSSKEFLAGPMLSGLLHQNETTVILGHILGHPVPENSFLADVLPRMSTPRNRPRGQPVHLSRRSASLLCSGDITTSADGAMLRNGRRWGGKKYGKKDPKKSGKKKSKSCSPDREALEGHKRSTGSCIVEYVFSALSCVFD